jgi:hypothetical protein
MKMEKKITVADLTTAAEKKAAERKARRVDFINKMLSIMEDGKEYRCKELAKMMRAQTARKGTTSQGIASAMRTLAELGWVVRTTRKGEPCTFEDWIQDEITVNGRKYYSESYLGKRTVIPKIAYYSLA